MININSVSLNENYKDLSYKLPNSERVFAVESISLTSTVVIFLADTALFENAALEIIVSAGHRFIPQMKVYVEVIRCKKLNNGHYEIECEIKGIKEWC